MEGEGEFIESGAVAKEKAVIAPYRDKGEWYFSPMIVTSFGWEPLLKLASNKALQLTAREHASQVTSLLQVESDRARRS